MYKRETARQMTRLGWEGSWQSTRGGTCFGFHDTVLASEEEMDIIFCHSEQKSVYEVYEGRRRTLIIDKKGDFNTTAMGEIKVQKCPILLD